MAYTNVLKPGNYTIRNAKLPSLCMHEDRSFDVYGVNCTQFGRPDAWQVNSASGSAGWTIQQNSTKSFLAFSLATINNTAGSPLMILVEPKPFTWTIVPSPTFGMRISSAKVTGCIDAYSSNGVVSSDSKNISLILSTCVETNPDSGTHWQDWVFENIKDFNV